jgi:hypothetical protein
MVFEGVIKWAEAKIEHLVFPYCHPTLYTPLSEPKWAGNFQKAFTSVPGAFDKTNSFGEKLQETELVATLCQSTFSQAHLL